MIEFKPIVIFTDSLPDTLALTMHLGFKPATWLVIHDKVLNAQRPFAKWLKNFDSSYGVRAGEKLKNADDFFRHLRRISRRLGPSVSRSSTCIVAVGGGSVGDFAGFAASVFKRGLPLVHVPSTLLAAIDSAHGGKTALNLDGIKNQVGTFYPPRAVVMASSLLKTLPKKQLRAAAGELCKTALLAGGSLFTDLLASPLEGFELYWNFLPMAVRWKYEVVLRDPFERTGERQLLNLGHTLGHCLEAHYGLPHGEAVAWGLKFALEWSHHRGYLSAADLAAGTHLLQLRIGTMAMDEFVGQHKPLSRRRLRRLVTADKKLLDSDHINFVFLEKLGVGFVKAVSVDSLLTEVQRQGWIAT